MAGLIRWTRPFLVPLGSEYSSPSCVADLDDLADEHAVIVNLAEALHLYHLTGGPWWECRFRACERALAATPVPYLAAAIRRWSQPEEGA